MTRPRAHLPVVRRSAPRPPEGPLDPQLEAAAARILEARRGKAIYKGGPPRAGAIADRLVRPLARAQAEGLTLADLKRQWRDIVGDKLATMTEPERISDSKTGRTLTIKAAGPAAPYIQHQLPLIQERCNVAGAAVTRISVKQGVIARPAGNVRPLRMPLSADEESLLQSSLDGIDSPRLKDALLRLGRSVRHR